MRQMADKIVKVKATVFNGSDPGPAPKPVSASKEEDTKTGDGVMGCVGGFVGMGCLLFAVTVVTLVLYFSKWFLNWLLP